jgi:late competence protein required for DNA uptake (superfamily II DNA/RNA helicase)
VYIHLIKGEKMHIKNLRNYQQEAVEAGMNCWGNKKRNLIVIPTGGGKTHVIVALAELAKAHGHQVLIVTPRRRLLQQTREKLHHVNHGVLAAGQGEDTGTNHRIIVGTVQTLIRRNHFAPTLIIFDECHMVNPDSRHGELIKMHPDATVIGLTATAIRGTDPLVELGWDMTFEIGILNLVEKGHLVPPRSVATQGGSVSADSALDEVTPAIIPGLIDGIQREGCFKPLVFAADIKHAEAVVSLLQEAGERAAVIHSGMKLATQNDKINEFEQLSERVWLVNVGLISVGVDIPCIDAVVLMRDVNRFAVLAQAIGRGLRPFQEKKECLVFDFGEGTKRFGFIDSPTIVAGNFVEGLGGARTKACPACNTLCYVQAKTCPHCSYTFSFKAHIRSSAAEVDLLSRRLRILTISDAVVTQARKGWTTRYSYTNFPGVRTYECSKERCVPLSGGTKVLVEMQTDNVADIQQVMR